MRKSYSDITNNASGNIRRMVSNINPSYHKIFSSICKIRFSYLATRFLFTLTISTFVSIRLFQKFIFRHLYYEYYYMYSQNAISSNNNNFLLNILILLPIKLLALYLGIIIIYITRKYYLHVTYNTTSGITYLKRTFKKITLYECIYIASFVLINSSCLNIFNIYSNFNTTFRFKTVVTFIVPLIYSTQHVIFDFDRLFFVNKKSINYQSPQTYITSRLKKSLEKTFFLSLFSFFTILIIYKVDPLYAVASININKLPKLSDLFLSLMSISITLQLWEWANISFNAYLSIGPLHRGTLLSSLSSSSFFSSPNSASPMETLISGLKSKNNFTKLTAFQELSYRARSSHVQFRYPIYHQSRQVWPSILAECFNTINDTNTKVSEYLLKVDTIGQGKNYTSVEEKQRREGSMYDLDTTNNGDNLFGNDTKTFENGSYSTLYNTNYYNNNNNNSNNNAFNIYSNKNIFLNTNKSKSSANDKGMEENFTSESVQTNILSTIVIPFIIKMVNIGISRFFFPDVVANSANNINNTVTDGTIIPTNLITENLKNLNRKLFSNVQRDSIRLCPLPNVYADSVLSLTGILLNALEEEPHSSCTGNIGDVLKILERSISILGGFVEYSEKIHKLDNKTEQEVIPKTVLSILYDLSVNAFLELVLRYNETLNNIYLDEEVKSLVKWVSEMINQE